MKKNTLRFAIALSCGLLMSGAFLTSCKDSNAETVVEETEEEKSYYDRTLATAEVEYQVSLGSDELSIYDVEVIYTNEKGEEISFPMTKDEWSLKRSLKPEDLPASFVLRAKPSRKTGLDLEADKKYEVGCITKIYVVVKNKYGRVICERDGMGLSQTEFTDLTGSQIMNDMSSMVTDWMGSLFSTDKKTLDVYSDKIEYNDFTERYW